MSVGNRLKCSWLNVYLAFFIGCGDFFFLHFFCFSVVCCSNSVLIVHVNKIDTGKTWQFSVAYLRFQLFEWNKMRQIHAELLSQRLGDFCVILQWTLIKQQKYLVALKTQLFFFFSSDSYFISVFPSLSFSPSILSISPFRPLAPSFVPVNFFPSSSCLSHKNRFKLMSFSQAQMWHISEHEGSYWHIYMHKLLIAIFTEVNEKLIKEHSWVLLRMRQRIWS